MMSVARTVAQTVGVRLGALSKQEQVFNFATADGTVSLDIDIKLPIGKSVTINWGDGTENTYNGEGNIKVETNKTYANIGTFPIKISGDYAELTVLDGSYDNLSGSIFDWNKLTNIEELRFTNCDFTGNISVLSGLTKLSTFVMQNSKIEGDISVFATLPIEIISCANTFLTGDISIFNAYTKLRYLYLGNTDCYGDVALLKDNPFSYLSLPDAGFKFESPTAWTGRNHTILLQGNGMSSMQVDNALLAFAGGSFSGRIINLSGSNAAPSAAGETAIDTLRAAGNTVTVTGGY